MYEEPKRLVADGLADARKEYHRQAPADRVRRHRGGPDRPARLARARARDPDRREGDLLRVALRDQGELGDMRWTLARMRADAADWVGQSRARADEYAATGGPHPERLPVITLVTRMFTEQAEAAYRWAVWA
ncbi:hypothetical protein [Streptodolium elevatio]|uniref:Uncharacterized protein n=1 Tax=Streptodolium elevatio TaxID=3157996 RepID=A0ABV3DG98_9ACTN